MNQTLKAFLRGAASILDLFPSSTRLPETSDEKALRSDWQMVGDDLRVAIGEFEKQRKGT